MTLNGLREYFAMGGDGRFIWSAYVVALSVLVAIFVVSLRSYHARRAELNALQESDISDSSDRNSDEIL